MVESYNTTLNLYEAGEFDWIGRNASLPSEFMNTSKGSTTSVGPRTSAYFYWINTKAPPLDDPSCAARCRSRSIASRWSTT